MTSIGTRLLCVAQGLFKPSKSELTNRVRLGLGKYAMTLHHAHFLSPEKRDELMSELVHCIDKDYLSDEQFYECVLTLRSADEVRFHLKDVQDELRSHFGETKDSNVQPTFEDKYQVQSPKKIKRQKTNHWNSTTLLNKIVEDIYDQNPEESDFDVVDNTPEGILYVHVDHPNQERDLLKDLETLLENDRNQLKMMPKGVMLSLLHEIHNVLDRNDISEMPRKMVENLKRLSDDYDVFENSTLYE